MSKFFKQKNTGRQILSLSKGFTLVETLVAISIFTVSLLGMMSVLGSSIANTSYAKQKMLATYLAQEGIEYVRNMRDTYILYPANGGWSGGNSFQSKLISCKDGNNNACGVNSSVLTTNSQFIIQCGSGTQCNLNVNTNGSYSINHSSGTDSGFVRKVWMTGADGLSTVTSADEEVKIFSNVSWTQRSGNYSITFSENLFNWVGL